jgi:uncharacterized protein (DUF697 family)
MSGAGAETVNEQEIADRARQVAPIVWLIGKVQSGKTSIVRELTKSSRAEVGNGFQACTRWSQVFDFPVEAPIIRFLDTRGLGEPTYDPREDIAFCETRAHLLLVVAKVMDVAQEPVLQTVRAVRKAHPEWPVVVAQTCLHEGYAKGGRHVTPYPFGSWEQDIDALIPLQLVRALAHQRSLFSDLDIGRDRFVPIDFTQPNDGYEPAAYGREALIAALTDAAPAALSVALDELPHAKGGGTAAASNAHVLGFSLAAGASDTLPFIGIVTVPAAQAAMLRQLARLAGARWDRRAYVEFLGALGIASLARAAFGLGARQLAKLVPVYGQTVGAASAAGVSFATTYAIGKAAQYYLAERERSVDRSEISAVYRSALREAFDLAKDTVFTKPGEEGP